MTRNSAMIVLLLVAGAAGVGSYIATTVVAQNDHDHRFAQAPPPRDRDNDARPHPRFAGPKNPDQPGGPGNPVDDSHILRFLNLTDEQAQQVKIIDPDFRDDMRQNVDDLRRQRLRLAELMSKSDSTDEQILTQLDKVLALNGQLEHRVTEHLLKLRSILDDQQRQRLMRLAAMRIRGGGPPHLRRGQDPPGSPREDGPRRFNDQRHPRNDNLPPPPAPPAD